ncbi:hypothetical protein RRG08_003662 [Elysia crispata]|uniref:Uncharacterized protein n=1 Tax=Elysia crispata TaxID=231223 RepID=A0AAE1AW77_9GAST|nr:hypothetical protein RRG08_003662 [Elysia crispata]
MHSENTHSPIVLCQEEFSGNNPNTSVSVVSSDEEEAPGRDSRAMSDASMKSEKEILASINNQPLLKQSPRFSSPTINNMVKQISSLSSSKQDIVKQEPGVHSGNTHSPIVQLQEELSRTIPDTSVFVLSSDDEEFAPSESNTMTVDSKKSEREMSFSKSASIYNQPPQKEHNPETEKFFSILQNEKASSGHKGSALKHSFSKSPSVRSKVRKCLASAFDSSGKKEQATSNLQPTVELAVKMETSECVSVVNSATNSSNCESFDSLNNFSLRIGKNNDNKLSPKEGYENVPGSSMMLDKVSEKATAVGQSIPELYGQWTEAAQELGLIDSAISHGRPTQLLLPTPLVLSQLMSLAGEGNCMEEDVSTQAVTYLNGWLNLHSPCNTDVARIYAYAFRLVERDNTYLLDWIRKCALVPAASSDFTHFQALLSYFVSVLQLNFNHCIKVGDKKLLQNCLVVSWLWENPLGVFHTSRTCQLVKLLEKMLQSSSDSPSKQVGLAAFESVCSLIGLAAESVRLASNNWDHSSESYGSDTVTAIVRDIGRSISNYKHNLSSEMTLLLLNFIKPPWLRAAVTSYILSSSFNHYLLSDVIEARNLSLYIIVTQYFFLVPPVSANIRDKVTFQVIKTDENKEKDNIVDRAALMNKKKPKLQITKRNHKGETVLHTACIKNNVELLEEILSKPNVEVNIQDAIGWTPLHEACNHGNLRCVELLLQYVPESSDKQGMITCINTKVRERSADCNSKYCNKTDISDSFVEDKKRERSIMRKADLNAVGPDGITPLHDAVRNNHVAICRLLLQYGGQRLLMARTVLGYTALDLAETVEMANVLKRFSSASKNEHSTETSYGLSNHDDSQTEGNVVLSEGGEKAPLDSLMKKKKRKLQLTKRNHKGETVLHTACIKNNVELLEEILSQPNVEVNIQDAIGWTPLHEACNHGNLRCVELLLQYVPESSDKQGMITCINTKVRERSADCNSKYCNKTDISDSFVEDKKRERSIMRKADLNAVGPDGITPLHDAVRNNHVAICRLLLQYGGQRLLMARTVLGYTALDLAETVEMANVLKRFSSASKDEHSTETSYGLSNHDDSQSEGNVVLSEGGEKAPLDSLMKKKKRKLQLTKRNHKGETVLHTACIKNNVELLEEILSQPNVEVNIQDAIGWTPLHEACNHGNLRCVELLLQYVPESIDKQDMITCINTNVRERSADCNSQYHRNTDISDSIVEDKKERSNMRKADLNAVGPDGITPLHDAVRNNHVAICRLLLQYGGQRLLMARTVLGYTALDLAETVEMANALKRFSSASKDEHSTETSYGLSNHDHSQIEGNVVLSDGGELAPLDSLYAVLVGEKTRRFVSYDDFSHFLSLLSTLFSAYCESRNLNDQKNKDNKTPQVDDSCSGDQAEPKGRKSAVQDLPSPDTTSDWSVLIINDSEFTVVVIREWKTLWPELCLVHGKPRHPQSQGSVEHANIHKKDMLISRMSDTTTTQCLLNDIACDASSTLPTSLLVCPSQCPRFA